MNHCFFSTQFVSMADFSQQIYFNQIYLSNIFIFFFIKKKSEKLIITIYVVYNFPWLETKWKIIGTDKKLTRARWANYEWQMNGIFFCLFFFWFEARCTGRDVHSLKFKMYVLVQSWMVDVIGWYLAAKWMNF